MLKHRFSWFFTILVFTGFGFITTLQPKPIKLLKGIPVLLKIINGNFDDFEFTKNSLISTGFELITDSELESVINLETKRRLSGISFTNGIDVEYHKNQITNGAPIYQILIIKINFNDSLKMDTIKEFNYKIVYVPKGGISKFPNQILPDSLIIKNDKQLLINQMLNIITK